MNAVYEGNNKPYPLCRLSLTPSEFQEFRGQFVKTDDESLNLKNVLNHLESKGYFISPCNIYNHAESETVSQYDDSPISSIVANQLNLFSEIQSTEIYSKLRELMNSPEEKYKGFDRFVSATLFIIALPEEFGVGKHSGGSQTLLDEVCRIKGQLMELDHSCCCSDRFYFIFNYRTQ
jgi:hypothetical protein